MSFGAEMKDFITALQAGQKIFGDADDREYKRMRNKMLQQKMDQSDQEAPLKMEVLKARAARLKRGFKPTDPETTHFRQLRNQKLELDLDMARHPEKYQPKEENPFKDMAPSLGKRSALDTGEDVAANDAEPDAYDTAEMDEGEYEQPTQFASRGGAIKYYADGGYVDDDEDMASEPDSDADDAGDMSQDTEADDMDYEDAVAQQRSAIATSPSAAPAAPQQQPVQKAGPAYNQQAAKDGAQLGLQYAKDTDGGTTEISAASRKSTGSYQRRAGAAAPKEMMQIREAIKAKNPDLSEGELTMASLAFAMEYHTKLGDAAGAKNMLASMMQYYGAMSDRYRALAQVAAEHGDVNGTVQAIMKAYANTPDGKDIRLHNTGEGGLSYEMVDTATGKAIEKGVASPDEILAWATSGSIPNFDSLMEKATGKKAQGPKEPKGMTVRDQATVEKMAAPEGEDIPDDVQSLTKNLMMAPQNRGKLNSNDARTTAKLLADPTQAVTQSAQVDGGRLVQFGERPPVFVPQDQWDFVAAQRAKAKAEAGKKQAAADEEAKKPGLGSRIVTSVGNAIEAGHPGFKASVSRGYNKAMQANKKVRDARRALPLE